MELRCPGCSSTLQPRLYEGVAVHACPACEGTLVGKRELEQIVRNREQPIPRNLPAPRPRTEATRTCPRCQAPMKKGRYGKLRVTRLDMCEPCATLWLDAGELESIQLDYELVSQNKARAAAKAVSAAAPAAAAGGPVAASAGVTAQPTPASFACPKCGHAQPQGTECVRCGIVFAKYERIQQEQAAVDAEFARLSEGVENALREVRGYEIRQQRHLSEAFLGIERANRYVMVPSGRAATWEIREVNHSGLSILGRNFLGALYTFTMEVLDEANRCVLTFQRRARYYFYHLDVLDHTGRLVGYARRRFSYFNRVVTVHGPNHQEVLRIVGPYHRPWTFNVTCDGAEAGSIVKNWSGYFTEAYTDADRFNVRFGPALDTRARRLLLGATILIDSLYFEGGRNSFFQHFVSAPGVQVLLVAGLVILAFWMS